MPSCQWRNIWNLNDQREGEETTEKMRREKGNRVVGDDKSVSGGMEKAIKGGGK